MNDKEVRAKGTRGFAVRERRFFFMSHDSTYNYFEKMAHWSFDEFGIHEECLTDWDLYKILNSLATPASRILDLGTAGGEKILSFFPDCAEILGTDYSPHMIDTALSNLAKSGRKNISFKVMDNLNMDVPDGYFDIISDGTMVVPNTNNRNLKWEKTTTTNVGIDWGVLAQRLTGSIDVYYRKTTDLINQAPTAAFAG